ncbi:hypothetical protein Rhopal_007428-T1 [Rhodotorula paludigena]|uniref:Peptidase M1 leukotriene A4 hydrolase/aminopeptidase C-terminal domain-containing protein n=1 Tax=Rhodotorula paludigena TaxID=86838 RepID=A0AAV5GYS9_9BASI|nr:hypothetical protein Rhopal_007428-T1 [Rhodotorula paludigena]
MAPTAPHNDRDTATQSNYQDVATTHLHLDLTVDWAQRILRGSVTHSLAVHADSVDKVVFDSSYLAVKRAYLATAERPSSSDASAAQKHDELPISLPAKRHPALGSALSIALPRAYNKGETVRLTIEYATTDECTALGWLNKEQTDSGKYPFMYSQCQAIHARSLVPCQDTPGVKATYSASIHSPLPILLSALRTSPPLDAPSPPIDGTVHTWEWEQKIGIPSYLIAIAGGELAFKALGERTGIWAEPGMLDRAAWEFAEDAEKIVSIAEDICGPYVWGRYDALVLPNSFPYGGMENPNMTFLTPALIVGDRSQVDVLAHEASHSWHGNNVSCAAWTDFWLNEGNTTYTERVIALRLHGEATRDFEYILGRKALLDDLKRYDNDKIRKGQKLVIPYEFGEDPDDFYSGVAYEKGANFLLYLERVVGGLEVFTPYQKDYIKSFMGKSVSTSDWERHFWEYWNRYPEKAQKLRDEVDFDAWLNGTGLELPVKMEYDTSLADAAYALAQRWSDARRASLANLEARFSRDADLGQLSSTQIIVFLETLETYDAFKRGESKVVEAMEKVYRFGAESKNPEILLRWFLVALKGGFYAKEAAEWVRRQGRMKYCRPIYRSLNTVDPELAKKTFLEYGVGFLHPIARTMIAKDLGLESADKK